MRVVVLTLAALKDVEEQKKKVANQSTADYYTVGEEKEEEQNKDDEEEQVTRAENLDVRLPISLSIHPPFVDRGTDEQNIPPSATPDVLNTLPSATLEAGCRDSELPRATAVSTQPVYAA